MQSDNLNCGLLLQFDILPVFIFSAIYRPRAMPSPAYISKLPRCFTMRIFCLLFYWPSHSRQHYQLFCIYCRRCFWRRLPPIKRFAGPVREYRFFSCIPCRPFIKFYACTLSRRISSHNFIIRNASASVSDALMDWPPMLALWNLCAISIISKKFRFVVSFIFSLV